MEDRPEHPTPVILNDESKAKNQSRAQPLDITNPLTRAFFAALVVGICVELSAQQYGSWLAGLSMIAYFGYGLSLPASARNTERFADSLYYLGFILTLLALLIAMTPSLNGGDVIRSETIIEKFGIAIVTTFVGITLRIILIQLKPNVSDHEEDTRESIAAYVAGLHKEIEDSTTEIRRFRSSVSSILAHNLEDFEKGLTDNNKVAGQALTNASDELLRRLTVATQTVQSAVTEVSDKLRRLDVPTDYLTVRINEAGDSLSKNIGQLTDRISVSSSALADALERNTSNLGQIQSDTAGLQKLLAKVNKAVTQTSEAADKAMDDAKARLADAELATAGIRQLTVTAGEMASQLKAVGFALDERAKNYSSEIDQASKAFQTSGTALSSVLADTAADIRKALDEVSKAP
jgi:methyl-accepting chemotaxis protein